MDDINISKGLIDALRDARYVVALTGAGISAESGLPTFREAQTGLWAKYRPEDLATPQAFVRNPKLVWEWYAWRRKLVSDARPNAGHLALVELERRVPRFTLITQNVDGLHRIAGSQTVIELHGNITRARCFREGTPVDSRLESGEIPPPCPHCGAPLRPDVVWFGESLPAEALDAAWSAAQDCDVFLSIGTSGIVQPAASLPYEALDAGAAVVEVNPAETPLTPQATYVLQGSAVRVLPPMVRLAWPPHSV